MSVTTTANFKKTPHCIVLIEGVNSSSSLSSGANVRNKSGVTSPTKVKAAAAAPTVFDKMSMTIPMQKPSTT